MAVAAGQFTVSRRCKSYIHSVCRSFGTGATGGIILIRSFMPGYNHMPLPSIFKQKYILSTHRNRVRLDSSVLYFGLVILKSRITPYFAFCFWYVRKTFS